MHLGRTLWIPLYNNHTHSASSPLCKRWPWTSRLDPQPHKQQRWRNADPKPKHIIRRNGIKCRKKQSKHKHTNTRSSNASWGRAAYFVSEKYAIWINVNNHMWKRPYAYTCVNQHQKKQQHVHHAPEPKTTATQSKNKTIDKHQHGVHTHSPNKKSKKKHKC